MFLAAWRDMPTAAKIAAKRAGIAIEGEDED
jgi:hypothetical protein